MGCRSLKAVELPSRLTEIRDRAFHSCVSLEKIYIPSTVSKMGSYIFEDCHSLSEIICDLPKYPTGWSGLWNAAFTGMPPDECAIKWKNTVAVKLSASSLMDKRALEALIYEEANGFYTVTGVKDKSVKSITIPKNTVRIESEAFRNCHALSSVFLPSGLLSIGAEAFAYCKELVSISLPRGLMEISDFAFAYSGITKLKIPSSVETVGDYVVMGCNDLRVISCDIASRPSGWSAIWNCTFPNNAPHPAETVWKD